MDINKKINDLRFERGWSMYQLAEHSNMTQSTLTSMMSRKSPPKIETLQLLCDAFGITLAQFFLEDEEYELLNQEEKNLITRFRTLPNDKKQALIELLNR